LSVLRTLNQRLSCPVGRADLIIHLTVSESPPKCPACLSGSPKGRHNLTPQIDTPQVRPSDRPVGMGRRPAKFHEKTLWGRLPTCRRLVIGAPLARETSPLRSAVVFRPCRGFSEGELRPTHFACSVPTLHASYKSPASFHTNPESPSARASLKSSATCEKP